MDGGTGNDVLNGNQGDDKYIFGRGYGNDKIYEWYGNDTIKFIDINPEDIIITRERTATGSNQYGLEIKVKDSEDSLYIYEYFRYEQRQVETLEFADGTVWGTEEIQNALRTLEGTDANETLTPTYDSTTIYGYGGNDTLNGTSGTDVLDGGTGNDVLNGGQGDDTYIFGKGYNTDSINEYYGNDTLMLSNITPYELMFVRENNILKMLTNDEDSISINSWYKSSIYQVENMVSDNGMAICNTSVDKLIEAMSELSNEKGLTWSELISNGDSDMKDVVNQFWVSEK